MKPFTSLNNFALLFIFLFIMSNDIPDRLHNSASFDLPKLNRVIPSYHAYAHNDYEHPNPLTDALKLGFTFIEADIHLLNDSLYVSHYRPLFPNSKKTLSKLYLEPLFKIQHLNKGHIFPNQPRPLVLMVDIKTEAEKTYQKLKEVLVPYQEMLCSWENKKEQTRAVKIIISGNRPIQTILQEELRYVQVDGRLDDLAYDYPADFMPIISDNFTKVFGFTFFKKKNLKPKELKKLSDLNKKIHAQNKIIRLWNSPEEENVWGQLIQHGVDLINTDQLEKLNIYLNNSLEHLQDFTSE